MNKYLSEHDILISKYLDNEISESEQYQLEQWVEDSIDNENHFKEVSKIWENSRIISQDIKGLNQKANLIIAKQERKRRKITMIRVASSVAAILILAFALHIFYPHLSGQNRVITAIAENSKQEVVLPDGSVVWLNANSSLSYPANFKKGRKANLSGEALFDIKSSKGNNFIVTTNDITIEVLGTRFLVTEHDQSNLSETILEEGTINLTINKSNELIKVSPNQKVTYDSERNTSYTELVVASDYTSWRNSSLLFENKKLSEVFIQLEKWYNVEIECNNQALLNIPVSFTIDDEPLDEILGNLKDITSLTWTYNSINELFVR